MVLAGSGATISAKLMSTKTQSQTTQGSIVTEFNHPVLMSFLMFVGEALLLLIYKLLKLRETSSKMQT